MLVFTRRHLAPLSCRISSLAWRAGSSSSWSAVMITPQQRPERTWQTDFPTGEDQWTERCLSEWTHVVVVADVPFLIQNKKKRAAFPIEWVKNSSHGIAHSLSNSWRRGPIGGCFLGQSVGGCCSREDSTGALARTVCESTAARCGGINKIINFLKSSL